MPKAQENKIIGYFKTLEFIFEIASILQFVQHFVVLWENQSIALPRFRVSGKRLLYFRFDF